MATVEAPIHQNVKDTMVKATERDTVLIFRTLHNTARVFKNAVSLEVVAIENRPNSKFEDVQHLVTGVRGRRVYETGDVNAGIWFVSMVLGLINDIPTCQELLDRIVSEAEATIDRISALKAPKSRL
jgi:NADH:quinone reductase (non-electrogenic)